MGVVPLGVEVIQADEHPVNSRLFEPGDGMLEQELAVGEDGTDAAVFVDGGDQVVDLS